MRISAKTDYAVRALVVLATRDPEGSRSVKADEIARVAAVPGKFLEAILVLLRREGLIESKRGADGGYRLARPAEEITVGDVVRAIDGPPALVAGRPPQALSSPEDASLAAEMWQGVAEAYIETLDGVAIATLTTRLPTVDFQI
jgi:Rrf2 family protein